MKQQRKSTVLLAGLCLSLLMVLLPCPATHAQHNIVWGPLDLTLGASAGASYIDNVNNSQNDPKSDFRLDFGPTVNGGITLIPHLPGGEKLVMGLALNYSLRYSFRLNQVQTFSAPIGASLTIPLRILEWQVTLFDTFSFSNEPLETTFAVNRNEVPQYNNLGALSISRQFGRVGLALGVSRTDQFTPDDPDQEYDQYSFSITPSYMVSDRLSLFLANSYGITEQQPPNRNSTGYSTELGINGVITRSITGSLGVGWAHSELDATKTEGVSHFDGITSTIALAYTNPLRPNTMHSLSFYRSPGVTAVLKDSNITEVLGVTYTIAHKLNRNTTLSPQVSYLNAKALSGSHEDTDLVVLQLDLNRQIGPKLWGHAYYRFQTRSSNIPEGNYDVNEVGVSVGYTF